MYSSTVRIIVRILVRIRKWHWGTCRNFQQEVLLPVTAVPRRVILESIPTGIKSKQESKSGCQRLGKCTNVSAMTGHLTVGSYYETGLLENATN
jgi:hypothetical protein